MSIRNKLKIFSYAEVHTNDDDNSEKDRVIGFG